MLPEIDVIAPPVIRSLENRNRFEAVISILALDYREVATAKIGDRSVCVSAATRHCLVEIRKTRTKERAIAAVAHVRKNDESTLQMLVDFKFVIQSSEVTNYVLRDALHLRDL